LHRIIGSVAQEAHFLAEDLLKEYIAREIGVEDGEFHAFSKGLHLYEHAWDLAKMVLRIPLE